ncbi:P-loop containing nucleoside triphosphate hydrolase protein [Chaetomium fimeti]|uniref:P-loop containing nucleoside triphosphate hydrolase protein n=1 Tax=Chaetomium fimeti TaxID=1854472 RepID=A0AAE0HNQ9_9PEZI|nr:P-loop containing nucleoside triphosphate hydrolase protein [Chaetomium fimeti]
MTQADAISKSDALIALMGLTGAGKTTFANVAVGDPTKLQVGHGVNPCTQDPQIVRFALDGRTVVLIDTPGFDDDTRSDVEILQDIVKWLADKGYLKKYRLDGLIMLHPITMNRVGGTERRRTRLLQKILGEKAYERIIIATTMWDDMKSEDAMQSRLDGRKAAGGVWAELVGKGTQIVRHQNNQESTHKIIRKIIKTSDRLGKLEPLLQTELEINPRVVTTSAGKEVKSEILKSIKKTRKDIKEHQQTRPQRPGKRCSDATIRREWKEWREDERLLDEKLDMLEFRLKKLNSLSFRFKSFLSSLFGR